MPAWAWQPSIPPQGGPFRRWNDLSVTTDDKRPLPSFGAKGCFGEPLLALIHALWKNHAGIPAAARALEAVGASSRKRYDLWRPAGIGAWFSLLRPGPPLHVIMHPSPGHCPEWRQEPSTRQNRALRPRRIGMAGHGQNRRNRKGLFLGRCCALAQGRKPSCHAGALWLLIFLFLHSLLLPEMRVASKAVSHKADKFIAALGLR